MPEMKYYVTYGNWKPEYSGPDKMRKAAEEWSKKVKEAGLEIVFWGSALGVPESAIFVYKGTPENYMKLLPAGAPYTNSRTNVVLTF